MLRDVEETVTLRQASAPIVQAALKSSMLHKKLSNEVIAPQF